MATGIPIDGEKLAAMWRESLLPQELFATKMGLGRSGLGRLVSPGVHGVHARRLVKLAESLGVDVRELQKRLAPEKGAKAGKVSPDESAAERLLAGEPVLLEELRAHATVRGIGLAELLRDISRAWLTDNRPPHTGHSGINGLKQPVPPAPPSTASGQSPGAPARLPRRERPAGRNGR